jgi:hypothetical protein
VPENGQKGAVFGEFCLLIGNEIDLSKSFRLNLLDDLMGPKKCPGRGRGGGGRDLNVAGRARSSPEFHFLPALW